MSWEEYFCKKRLDITRAEFEKFTDAYITKYGLDKTWIDKFISAIDRAGVLDLRDTVTFRHRSFLEYFIALAMFTRHTDLGDVTERLTELYFSDLWDDVSFFFIGIRKSLTIEMLHSILSYPKDNLSTLVGKYTVGRLLQAGWLSPIDVKREGIMSSIAFFGLIREWVKKSIAGKSENIGMIFADFFPIILAEWALGSITVSNQIRGIIKSREALNSEEELWQNLALLSSVWRFLDPEEKIGFGTNLLSKISSNTEISQQDKGGMLLILNLVEDKEKNIRPSIEKKIAQINKHNPEIFKQLLPPVRRGFRRKPKK